MPNCKKCERPMDMYSNTGLCTYHLLKLENKDSFERRERFFRTMTVTFLILLAIVMIIGIMRINSLATITSYFYVLYLSGFAGISMYLTYYYHQIQK